jgi:hypothetical protein
MKHLIFLAFVVFLNSCGHGTNSSENSQDQEMRTGFELVDQGRYDEAARYFEGLYRVKQTDEALKGWASVYIAKSGLQVASLYKAFTTLPSETKVTAENVLVQVQAYKKSLDQIPYLKDENRDNLKTASKLLQQRSTSTVRLLRAIVNLVLLRSTFSDGDKLLLKANLKIQSDKDLKPVCKIEWKALRAWLKDWSFYGLELKTDLDYALPSKKSQWASGEGFFKQVQNFSTTIVRTCDP